MTKHYFSFMKTIIIISATLLVGLFSCKQPDKKDDSKADTPKALQEKDYSDISLSSRGYDNDLVNELYNEQVNKSPELRDIESTIDKLAAIKADSLHSFELFDQKNVSYYTSVNQYLQQIKDSVVREKMKALINNSMAQYNNKTDRHKNLIALLGKKESSLADLHIVLKLMKTLPVIQKFQADHIPPVHPIEKTIEAFDKAIQRVDTLTKQ